MIPEERIDPAESSLEVARIRVEQAVAEVALASDQISSATHSALRAEAMDLIGRLGGMLDRLRAVAP